MRLDVRRFGDQNPGATNVFGSLGSPWCSPLRCCATQLLCNYATNTTRFPKRTNFSGNESQKNAS